MRSSNRKTLAPRPPEILRKGHRHQTSGRNRPGSHDHEIEIELDDYYHDDFKDYMDVVPD